MTAVVSFLIVVVLAVLSVRQWLLNRECGMRPGEAFDGVVYRVGSAAVAERRSVPDHTGDSPKATVICMHGFVENMGYFTQFYQDPDIQLILLTSCGYHVPIADPQYRQASWATVPSADEGTIEYDAMVLNQALEHLPKTDRIRVHGHSRGGAVALEAASLRPDLFEDVEVILEAPVLPQGMPYKSVPEAQLWCMSFLVPLWRRQPIARHNRAAWGPLDDERKRHLIEGLPFNPKRVSTMVTNMRSIGEWMETRSTCLFANVRRGCVLVPEKDRVLDAKTMYDSASQGATAEFKVVRLESCSHFPLFDCPESIPPLLLKDKPVELAQQSAMSGALSG
jgi:pimeloyl-ACP methyl ester carboxylesterase